MNARELKDKYINFFVSKGHKEIPSSSLTPENDPTTLFISAGMHPLVPYLLGQPHPLGKRLVDVQKCVRTGDIDEVGDQTHHTFFEMLGNWSLGDYFKKEMIPWSFEFLTKHLSFDVNRLSVTCFAGDNNAPKDEESENIWKSLGVKNIKFLSKEDNWWGPASITGPCGPDTEMFIDGVEVWNDVFMQYFKNSSGKFEKNSQINVDTGMGVERTVAFLNGFSDNYMSSIWQSIIKKIEEISGKKYVNNVIPTKNSVIPSEVEESDSIKKSMRIVADHIRSAVFIIADGVEPSNKEAGYVLRRLIRRSIRQGKILGIENNFTKQIAVAVLDNQDNYAGTYPELNENKEKILSILENEENKFRKALNSGLTKIENFIKSIKQNPEKFLYGNTPNFDVGLQAFDFYQNNGFPFEMLVEELNKNEIKFNHSKSKESFEELNKLHQKLSQTLSAGKFKSGLADNSEIITKYHTVTHLLHSALRKFLGDSVHQSGSNITSDRLRFDFNFDQKLTDNQLKEIENFVNEQIKKSLPVTCETMKFTDAQKQGALAFFGSKYPETVTVYTVGDLKDFSSKEVCTGPHIKNTNELGIFEITKEESAGAGKRRIYAILK